MINIHKQILRISSINALKKIGGKLIEIAHTKDISSYSLKERIANINAPERVEDMPSVDEVLRSLGSAFDLPRNLGRLTRFLLSPDKKQRLRGLQVLHRRFWHAKLQDMKLLLERGGVDILDEEIKAIILETVRFLSS